MTENEFRIIILRKHKETQRNTYRHFNKMTKTIKLMEIQQSIIKENLTEIFPLMHLITEIKMQVSVSTTE